MRDKEFRAKNKDSDFSHKTAADTALGRANRDNKDFSVPQNEGASARNSRYAKHQTDTDNSGTLNNAPYENRYDIRDADYNTDNQQPEQQAEDIREVMIDNQPDTPRRYSQPSHEQPKNGFSDTVSSAVKNRRYQQHYKREHSNETAAEQAESTEYSQTEPEQPNSYEQPEQPKQAENYTERTTEPEQSNTYEPTEYPEPPTEDADFLPRRSEPISPDNESAENEPIVENKPTTSKRSGDYNIRDASRTVDEAFDRITGKSDFRLGGDKLNRRAETAAEPKQQQRKRIYETAAETVDEADAEPTEVDITENKIADDTEFVKTDFQLGKQPEHAEEQTTAKSAEKPQQKNAFQKKHVKSDKSEVYNIKDAVDNKEEAFDKISESSDYEFKPRNNEYSFRQPIDTETITEPKKDKLKNKLYEKSEKSEATDAKAENVEPVRISDKTEFVKTDFQLGKQPERADEQPTAKSAEKPQQKTAFQKKRVKQDKSEVYNIKDAVDNKETAFDRVTEPVDYEFQTQGGEEYSFRPTTEESKAFDKHEPRLRQDKRQSKTEPIINTEPDASVPDTDIPEKGDFQFTRDTRKKTKSETAGAKPENPKQRQKSEQGKSEATNQDKPAKKSKRRLQFEDEKPKRDLTRPVRSAAGAAGFTAAQAAHSKVRESEDDNSGVEAAHFTEQKAERVLQFSSSRARNILNQHRQAEPLKKPQRLQFKPKNTEVKGNAVNSAELQKRSAVRKFLQKKQIKKKYQQAKRAEQNAQTAKKTVKTVKDVTVVTVEFVKRHKKAFAVVILIALLIAWVISTVSSCAVMGTTAVNSIMATTYLSEDEDIYAAEEYYKGLESDLQTEIDNIESDYSGYDEYNYDLAQIGHNPYELTSYLTAKYLDFVFDDTIKAELDSLFEQQYILTLTEDVEIYTDDEGNEYEYYILNVTLVNKSITALANTALTEDQRELYDIYLEGKGNRDYLFEDDIYSNPAEPPSYTIPGEALSDETFRRLITEAEKYLGYPYVWGGSSPSTSFDCSGFVCWVFKNSGVYPLERTTAQGICDQCAIIPRSEAKPGDIIFFTGTYNAGEPVTHVGIYVGDGMMIHCGNPIQYASIDTPYWTEHFYCFGRLN